MPTNSEAAPSRLRTEAKLCHHARCSKPTTGDKDYCLLHVAHNSYAKHVIEALENRNYEDAQVKLRGPEAANIEGITAKEILLELSQRGPRTVNRLSRNLRIEGGILRSYLVALKMSRKISESTTKRGAVVITTTAKIEVCV